MNILECTIKMKKETGAHYQCLAKSVSDGELKRLFSALAAAEEEHINKLIVLQNNFNSLAEDLNGLAGSVCVYSPHIDPQHLTEVLQHDPDAYRHVVQDEEETIEFFDQLSNQAENDLLKKMYRLQSDREREHLSKLENIYLFMEEPRTYLEWGEFSNLKSL